MPGTVVVLGCVSLLTDISTEMVTAVLPLFITVGLGLSPMAFGVLDSVYQAGTVAARVGGGYTADRLARPKAVAVAGYGLGMIAKV
ncbi:MAG: MFS transporter, partial [Spirillospora sp.]